MSAVVHAPLVSIAIVNWNYARFVVDAIQSVKDQTYRNLECVILDQGSTDGSPDTIRQAIGDDPRFSFHPLAENIGQLGGSLWLLDHLKGEFVTYLDADDVLLPDFVACHLEVHLGAAHATGFSSSNSLTVDARTVLLVGSGGDVQRRWPSTIPTSFNPENPRLTAIGDSDLNELHEATRYSPSHLQEWGWGFGSSNMFRRSLLERFRPGRAPKVIFGGVDGYFCPLMNAVSGTLLINIPLSLYRIHGNNDYAQLPLFEGIRQRGARAEKQTENGLLLAFSFLIGELDRALSIIPLPKYWTVLDSVASMLPPNFIQHPGVKNLLTEHFSELCEKLGRRTTLNYLTARWPTSDVLKHLHQADGGIPALSDLRTVFGLNKRALLRRFSPRPPARS